MREGRVRWARRSGVKAKVVAERRAALPQTREGKARVERRPQQRRQLAGFSPQRAQDRGNIGVAVGAHARDRRMRQGSFDRIGNDSYRGEGRAMPGGQPRRDMRDSMSTATAPVCVPSEALWR